MQSKNQINPNQKSIKIPSKFDSRFVFTETLNRICRVVSDSNSIESLVSNTQLPFVFTNNPTPLTFNYTLSEIATYNSYTKISWLLNHKDIMTPINLIFNITENTMDKTVLVVFEISIINRELVPEEYKTKVIQTFPAISVEMINNMDKQLQEDIKDLYQYESKIFYYSREKIWDTISNLNKIMKNKGYIEDYGNCEEPLREGNVLKFKMINDGHEVEIKITKVNHKKNETKWCIGYLPLKGRFIDAEASWIFLKLGENKTLISHVNKYLEHIDTQTLAHVSQKKKEVFEVMENQLKEKYGEPQES